MSSYLPAVAEQLLRDIRKVYQETSQIPDDLLLALKFVFGPSALQALDLVDQRSVTCLSSPSGRTAFQVIGGSGRPYTCYTSCHYCPCPAFAFSVLRRNDGLLVTAAHFLSETRGALEPPPFPPRGFRQRGDRSVPVSPRGGEEACGVSALQHEEEERC